MGDCWAGYSGFANRGIYLGNAESGNEFFGVVDFFVIVGLDSDCVV